MFESKDANHLLDVYIKIKYVITALIFGMCLIFWNFFLSELLHVFIRSGQSGIEPSSLLLEMIRCLNN